MPFHLVTINIKESNDPTAALAFKNEIVRKYSPDPVIFGVQEVDINARRSQRLNVAAFLAGQDDYRFIPTVEYDANSTMPCRRRKNAKESWLYGIALIASGCTINSSHAAALGPDDDLYWKEDPNTHKLKWELEPRKAIIAEILLPKGSAWVATTHLTFTENRDDPSSIRANQIESLIGAASTIILANAPLALCGDFNATVDNPDLAALTTSFSKANVDKPTKKVKSGGLVQIDHIFYRNLKPSAPAEVISTSFSDHCAVIAHFS